MTISCKIKTARWKLEFITSDESNKQKKKFEFKFLKIFNKIQTLDILGVSNRYKQLNIVIDNLDYR